MECPNPITVRTNTVIDGIKMTGTAPCGKCVACLSKRRSQWTLRLNEEARNSQAVHFVTLTYADKNLPMKNGIATLVKRDLQLFMKQIRVLQARTYYDSTTGEIMPEWAGKELLPVRFFGSGEYGPATQRPHYHLILFNVIKPIIENIHKIWLYGNVTVNIAKPGALHYVTKYLIQPMTCQPGQQKPFLLMSRRPGIGHSYLKRTGDYHQRTMNSFIVSNGTKHSLPRYYRDKIFDEDQKLVVSYTNSKTMEKRYDQETQRLIELGENPTQYREQQTIQNMARASKRASKNNKL